MHIYFLGIGGTGIGPLALIALQAGYEVSGSDAKESEYTHYLQSKGVELSIEPNTEHAVMAELHARKPIDWVVGVSAIVRLNPNEAHLVFARDNSIQVSERDACLNRILREKQMKMIAAAGTQGKTTTAAMTLWAMKQLGISVSHSLGAKMPYADMGHFEPGSEYFIYECDEFHRNFLHFSPAFSIISGIAWDHHEVYPTPEEYNAAFREFIEQSEQTILWDEDAARLSQEPKDGVYILEPKDENLAALHLAGVYNRRNAWLVIETLHRLFGADYGQLIDIMNRFPGTQRRMEEIMPNVFSDYAHTPEKIIGCMSTAEELAKMRHRKIVVIYEPLTNRRQHYVKEQYATCFGRADNIYWVPSYLSREHPGQAILSPEELITYLRNPEIAHPAQLNDDLWKAILHHQKESIVVCISGGGGGSLDEWLRAKARELNP